MWSSGNAVVSYEYARQNALYASERSFTGSVESPFTLEPLQNRNSLFGAINQEFSPDITVYAEGLYTSRYESAVQTIGGVESSGTNTVNQYGIAAGGQAQLWGDWSIYLDGVYSNDNVHAFGTSLYIYNDLSESGEVHATGTLLTLPTGSVKVALGGGYRSESYHDTSGDRGVRNIKYAYGEAVVPLIAPLR